MYSDTLFSLLARNLIFTELTTGLSLQLAGVARPTLTSYSYRCGVYLGMIIYSRPQLLPPPPAPSGSLRTFLKGFLAALLRAPAPMPLRSRRVTGVAL